MSITASKLRRLNRRFGEAFGFNPHGQPHFRWARTETLFRYTNQGSGYARSPGGILLFKPVHYTPRCWADRYGKCWILTKWKHYTESEWYGMVKDTMPYPKHGDWEPVDNIRLGPEYVGRDPEPTLDTTLEAIAAIHADRARRSDYHYDPNQLVLSRAIQDESKADHDRAVGSHVGLLDTMLKDLTPAFGKEPGTHSGSTEFMSGKT